MGMLTESAMLTQLKKAQGETNQRLSNLVTAQQRTNELIEWLGGVIQAGITEMRAGT